MKWPRYQTIEKDAPWMGFRIKSPFVNNLVRQLITVQVDFKFIDFVFELPLNFSIF